jgi:GT2 family glycosyltransferase
VSSDVAVIHFERTEYPRASIIVLGWRSAPLLLNCLDSIARNVHHVSYEVVITLNAPAAALLRDLAARVSGAVLVVSRANRGFGGGCNQGVAHARGEYVVLLNDDTEVEPGWLEALVATADRYPAAGAVGSRVLNPDGTLQEAGALVWDDGSAAAIGGSVLPVDPLVLNELRRVDYCGGEALLVRRSSWDAVQGFSDDFYPAYYEDVDLCFKIASRGEVVLFEPAARLRHASGASTSRRYRTFMMGRSKRLFVERWSAILADRDPPKPDDPVAVLEAIRRAAGAAQDGAVRYDGSLTDRFSPATSTPRPGELSAGGSESDTPDDAVWFERELEVQEQYSAELESTIAEMTVQIGVRDDLISAQQLEGARAAAERDAADHERNELLAELEAYKNRLVTRLIDRSWLGRSWQALRNLRPTRASRRALDQP